MLVVGVVKNLIQSQCPAKDWICFSCSKKGHTSRICRNNKKSACIRPATGAQTEGPLGTNRERNTKFEYSRMMPTNRGDGQLHTHAWCLLIRVIGNYTHTPDRLIYTRLLAHYGEGGRWRICRISGQCKLVMGIGGPVVGPVWCNDYRVQL